MTSPVNILVVDDDVTLRWVVCKQLDKLGLAADSAANGREALQRVEKWPYQLILMDVMMPVMDGCEAAKEIRKREETLGLPPVPIIALTADPDKEKCIEAGMTDYMLKPLDLEGLKNLLQIHLRRGPAANA